ncbi:helix-turn-helix domain-containing protein (plasmid) [Sphingobium yanoikuyae]|uniref:Helix-turn-helix domain-containing protein n=1 Tax=Sphingobium yanoikuyae TaxID=13690 RepID=A0A6P1GSP0_SPHYA|nr:helix-turn-helix transcriptional regulator [Sphingobium yanoikuyae]QHD70832.1 helix-turn-helix domain-containing protein [Sphingobium yanoikuyae]
MPRYLKLDQAASGLAKNLGTNCRERRAKLRISQAELSERTGVAASHLSYIEHGRANPTLEVMKLLADGLGCSVLDLLAEPEDRTS